METIKNVIFGTGEKPAGEEPVSGQTGEGTVEKPYDGGNAPGVTESGPGISDSSTTGATTGDDTTPTTTGGLPPTGPSQREQASTLTGNTSNYTSAAGSQATGGAVGAPQSHDKTGVTGAHTSDVQYTDKEGSNANASSTAEVGQSRGPVGGFGAAEPSVSAQPPTDKGPSSLDADTHGSEKPLQDPNDQSGKPLGTVDHGTGSGAGIDRRASLVDGSEGDVGPLNAKEKGTGEKYVKSTGMAAEGGDFDAAAPGAGKEANRLLEEKGVDRSSGSNTGEVQRAPGDSTDKEKVSLGKKLKEKLHIGSHKDK